MWLRRHKVVLWPAASLGRRMDATPCKRMCSRCEARAENRANRKPIWRAAPQRRHRKSQSAPLNSHHAPLHWLHEYHESPWPLQASGCVPVRSQESTLTLGHCAPNGRTASIAAGACELLSGAADAAPKKGPQTGPKSVPHNGSTNGWWNRKRGQILASIDGQFFDASKLPPLRGGRASSAERVQPRNPIMLMPTSSASCYGFDP